MSFFKKCSTSPLRPKLLAFGLYLVMLALTMPLLAANAGDYQTKWGGTWDTLSLWQTYNGSTWVDATSLPSSPFSKTIYVKHYISLNTPFKLIGNASMVVSNQMQFHPGCTFEVGSDAEISFKELRVTNGSVLINNGTLRTLAINSNITIEAGGELINNSLIDTNRFARFNFNLLSAGTLSIGDHGTISGNGNFSVSHNANINIAHPEGFDGAINVSGNKVYDRANIVFNGTRSQKTGTTMPANVLNISVENPAGLQLSKSVSVVNEFIIHTGSSVDLGLNIINKAWYGVGTFVLSPGATVVTAHPQGISSTDNVGSVLVTYRVYDSAANYSFNGTSVQQTGNFVTTPDDDPDDGLVPVANLIISNPNNVTITNPMMVSNNILVLEGNAEGLVKIEGESSIIDGLFSHNYYHSFAPNGVLIRNYIPQGDTYANKPNAISRRWNICGNFTGTKEITFYWEPEEDNGINWNLITPVIKQGGNTLIAEAWDTTSVPRWVKTTINALGDRSSFYILGSSDETLPVVLSAFNAIITHNNGVRLQWTTQSESGINGYYVWRAATNNVNNASIISLLIAPTNSSNLATYVYTDNEVAVGSEYWYWLESVEYSGVSSLFGPIQIKLESGNVSPNIPLVTALLAPYPNPFNPSVNISFSLAKEAKAQVNIYNHRGQLVRNLYSGNSKAGRQNLVWNGIDNNGQPCSSGTYLIIMESSGERYVQKASLVK